MISASASSECVGGRGRVWGLDLDWKGSARVWRAPYQVLEPLSPLPKAPSCWMHHQTQPLFQSASLCPLANPVFTVFSSVADGQSWDNSGMERRVTKNRVPAFLKMPDLLCLGVLLMASPVFLPVSGWSRGWCPEPIGQDSQEELQVGELCSPADSRRSGYSTAWGGGLSSHLSIRA